MSENFDKAVARAFSRTDEVLAAIKADGDVDAVITKTSKAQPWDLVSIGQGFVTDYIETGKVEDGKLNN